MAGSHGNGSPLSSSGDFRVRGRPPRGGLAAGPWQLVAGSENQFGGLVDGGLASGSSAEQCPGRRCALVVPWGPRSSRRTCAGSRGGLPATPLSRLMARLRALEHPAMVIPVPSCAQHQQTPPTLATGNASALADPELGVRRQLLIRAHALHQRQRLLPPEVAGPVGGPQAGAQTCQHQGLHQRSPGRTDCAGRSHRASPWVRKRPARPRRPRKGQALFGKSGQRHRRHAAAGDPAVSVKVPRLSGRSSALFQSSA